MQHCAYSEHTSEKHAILSPVQVVKVYHKLRVERMNQRVLGLRAKKAKDAAKEAE